MRFKVFGIGLHKTGTSTLQAALATFGYRIAGRHRKPLVKQVKAGQLKEVIARTATDDAFTDFPYPKIFRELHEHYGRNARFVLTTRRSAEIWYGSVCEHARTSRLFGSQKLTYGFYRPFGREGQYVSFYERHNDAVRRYFQEQGAADQLLEVCWENGDGWNELCRFLGEAVPDVSFPHRNKTDKRRLLHRRAFNYVIEAVYAPLVARGHDAGSQSEELVKNQ
jgi:hypothetical protein